MTEPLTDRLDAHLKTLRKADSQASAIAWMTAAYKLMEEAIQALREKPMTDTIERVVYVETAILPVVHHCPAPPTAKAWAHRDTLRMERKEVVWPKQQH